MPAGPGGFVLFWRIEERMREGGLEGRGGRGEFWEKPVSASRRCMHLQELEGSCSLKSESLRWWIQGPLGTIFEPSAE